MTTQRIAELEAEVMRLRDVIFDIAGEEPSFSWRKANDELSTPFTPTALNDLIEKVEKRTIERCAVAAGPEDSYQDDWFKAKCKSVEQIRALPTGQIKLEELL